MSVVPSGYLLTLLHEYNACFVSINNGNMLSSQTDVKLVSLNRLHKDNVRLYTHEQV